MDEAREKKTTIDHEQIRRWVRDRGGRPAHVKGTEHHDDQAGLLRIELPGHVGGETLEAIQWDEFFRRFEESALAFLYEEETESGRPSRFHRLISRRSLQGRE